MKRLIAAFTLVLFAGAPAWSALRAGGYATMHNEKESPRPAGVTIAGARPDKVVLYCTTISAGCKGLRAHLAKRGIDYLDKELTADSVAQAEFEALGGQGVPLVVFRDRLLHGYYPTGFERVYAQQASGQASRPPAESQRGADARGGETRPSPAAPSSKLARGAVVEDIAPEALGSYLARYPYVVVLFTSPDATCPPCVKSQPEFDAAAIGGLQAIRYVQVQWSPWSKYPAAVKPFYDKAYLPGITLYRQGRAIAHQSGYLGADQLNPHAEKHFGFAP